VSGRALDPDQEREVAELYPEKNTVELAEMYQVSRPTIRRTLERQGVDLKAARKSKFWARFRCQADGCPRQFLERRRDENRRVYCSSECRARSHPGIDRPRASDEALLRNLMRVALQLGRTPRQADLRELGAYGPHHYRRPRRTLTEVQRAAGMIPTRMGSSKEYPLDPHVRRAMEIYLRSYRNGGRDGD
jgi:hypothetical protein